MLGIFYHALKDPSLPRHLLQLEMPLHMCFLASGFSKIPVTIVDADLEVILLSNITLEGTPHLAVKRLTFLRNVVAVMSETRSRCMALVE